MKSSAKYHRPDEDAAGIKARGREFYTGDSQRLIEEFLVRQIKAGK